MRPLAIALLVSLLAGGTAVAQTAPFTVGANVALNAFVSLTDAHLRTVADTLETDAATPAAQSGEWANIRPMLARAAQINVPSGWVYIRPDGKYWTLDGGLQSSQVADRPYFKAAMAGHVSIGDLVVGRSTGNAVAVVAIPIKAANGHVSGILGAGVNLVALSALLVREMNLGPNDLFWAIDGHGTIALHSDQRNIFVSPAKMTPELAHVTADMLAHPSGAQSYAFRGHRRTVVYRGSSLTGWKYGFGLVGP